MSECTKVKFATEDYANFHITKHSKRNEALGLKARSYKCRYCDSWHITSKILNAELIADNEALREQLIDQIKLTEDLKAEVEVLKGKLKSRPQIRHGSPEIQQLNKKINNQRNEIKALRDQRNLLLSKLKSHG